MKKLSILAATGLVALGLGTAGVMADDVFDKYDGNHDGLLSWDEALAANATLTQDQFKQADANADGSLDAAEFTALIGLGFGPSDASAPSSEAPASDASSSSAQ